VEEDKNDGCGSIETGGCPPNTAFVVIMYIITLVQRKRISPSSPKKQNWSKGTRRESNRRNEG
jgi:hypothetical protein